MENIQEITLDIMNNHIFNYIYSKQYDQGRIIKFKIVENGKSFDITNVTAIFQAKKPDNTVIYNSCNKDIKNNILIIDLNEQLTVLSGTFPYQIQLVQDNMVLTTVTGKIKISPSVVKPDDIISTSEFNALNDALIQVNKGFAFYIEEVKRYETEIKEFATVKVSANEPQEESVALWINPVSDETINLPEIKDDIISQEDTWSSLKISTEINDLKKFISNGKNLIASAITEKGVETAADESFENMAEHIRSISVGEASKIGGAL